MVGAAFIAPATEADWADASGDPWNFPKKEKNQNMEAGSSIVCEGRLPEVSGTHYLNLQRVKYLDGHLGEEKG